MQHTMLYETHLHYAEQERKANKPLLAIQHYTEAMNLHFTFDICLERGDLYFELKDYAKSFLDYLCLALSNDPIYSASGFYKCWELFIHREDGFRLNEGACYLFKCMEIEPNLLNLNFIKDVKHQISSVTHSINNDWAIDKTEKYIYRGSLHLIDHNTVLAALDAKNALEAAWFINTKFRAHTFYGNICYSNQRYEDAILYYKMAIKVFYDGDITAREKSFTAYLCGKAYFKINNIRKGLRWLNYALDLNKNLILAELDLQAFLLTIESEEALQGVEKSLLIDAIKKLSLETTRIELLEKCLSKHNPLGKYMWTPDNNHTTCSLDKDYLKEICDYLELVHKHFIKPIILTSTKQNLFEPKIEVKKVDVEEYLLKENKVADNHYGL